MASPQSENGHIDIANEIAEALMKLNLTGYQYRVLWAIWRKTYGWHKKEDIISVSQLTEMTGLHHAHISRTLRELRCKNMITRTQRGTSREEVALSFQKDYEKWKLVPNRVQVKSMKLVPNGAQTRTQRGTELVPNGADTKERKKRKKRKHVLVLPDWLDKDLWKEVKRHRVKMKAPMTDYSEELFIRKLTSLVEGGHKPKKLINEMINRGWKTVFNPEGE